MRPAANAASGMVLWTYCGLGLYAGKWMHVADVASLVLCCFLCVLCSLHDGSATYCQPVLWLLLSQQLAGQRTRLHLQHAALAADIFGEHGMLKADGRGVVVLHIWTGGLCRTWRFPAGLAVLAAPMRSSIPLLLE